MRVMLLGETTEEYIARIKARPAMTYATAGKMEDYFNSQGGNTPLTPRPVIVDNGVDWFDKAFGIIGKLTNPASTTSREVYKVKSAPTPYLAFAGVALVGLFLYKAVK